MGVVGLEGQNVVGVSGHDVLGDGFLAPHGIYRDDAALDAVQFQWLGYGCDFVGLLVRLHLTQQHAVGARLGADDVQRAVISIARAAQTFAIYGDHALDLPGDALQPVDAHLLQYLGVRHLEHPPERVVRGYAVG